MDKNTELRSIGSKIHWKVIPIADDKIIIKHSLNRFQEIKLLSYQNKVKLNKPPISKMVMHTYIDTIIQVNNNLVSAYTLIRELCFEINHILLNAFKAVLNKTFISSLWQVTPKKLTS